jgi:hypothetical protein
MEVGEALLWAANELGNGTCGLAGHELSWDEKMDELVIQLMEGFDVTTLTGRCYLVTQVRFERKTIYR